MLFDLRGRGRRGTVRIIYIGLALLMGVGLIGFGIGGGFGGGGILNAASNNEGANSASFSKQIEKYRKLAQRQPSNAEAWEKLTEAQMHEAGGEAFVNPTTGLTSKGKVLFHEASESWTRYIALKPPTPSVKLAKDVLRLYDEEGLNEPAKAVEVLEIIVASDPESAAYYGDLAAYAYKAKNESIGDLAAAKAVTLAPSSQRQRLKRELAALKTEFIKSSTSTTKTGTSTSSTSTSKTSTSKTSTSTSKSSKSSSKK
jgi:hypothetical protein